MYKSMTRGLRRTGTRLHAGFVHLRNLYAMAFVSALAMFAGNAWASGGGADPAASITAALAGLADDVGGIIVLLAAALAVIILWQYVKKSR